MPPAASGVMPQPEVFPDGSAAHLLLDDFHGSLNLPQLFRRIVPVTFLGFPVQFIQGTGDVFHHAFDPLLFVGREVGVLGGDGGNEGFDCLGGDVDAVAFFRGDEIGEFVISFCWLAVASLS